VTRLLLAIYLVEAGLVLMFSPWTSFWDRNYFATVWPVLRDWLSSTVVRVSVTLVGCITLATGAREFTAAMAVRARARRPDSERRAPDA